MAISALLLVCLVIVIFYIYLAAFNESQHKCSNPLFWAVVLTIIHDSQIVGRNNGSGWMGFLPAVFFASCQTDVKRQKRTLDDQNLPSMKLVLALSQWQVFWS